MTERRETPPPFTQTGGGANTLVFIHGFLDDSSFWQPTIQALEARNLSLIIGGADDPFVTRELLTTSVFARFSRARSASISSAGHWPHLEQPVAVAKAIDGFLAQIGWSS